MRKKITVFAGFILMTVGFSMVNFSCRAKKYDLESISVSLWRATGLRADGSFIYDPVYNPNGITAITFDSLAISVSGNYTNSNSLSWEPLRRSKHEKVIDIIITSNKNYNAKYPAGSNLKGIMSANGKTIDAMLKYYSNVPPDPFYTFNTPPETEEVHDITFIYRTKKQKFIDVIKNVKILK